MIRIGSRRVFATAIRIVQVVTRLTDRQKREIYLSPIIIGPAIAVLVEPTATALLYIYISHPLQSWFKRKHADRQIYTYNNIIIIDSHFPPLPKLR